MNLFLVDNQCRSISNDVLMRSLGNESVLHEDLAEVVAIMLQVVMEFNRLEQALGSDLLDSGALHGL